MHASHFQAQNAIISLQLSAGVITGSRYQNSMLSTKYAQYMHGSHEYVYSYVHP
jgi:hypothetical protein